MLVLSAQVAISLCLLLFAVQARLIARDLPAGAREFRHGWALTGLAFLIQGLNSLFHDGFSIFAWLSGPASGAWKAILFWHPILNHSRTFLLTTFCVLLCAAMLRAGRDGGRVGRLPVLAILMAGMVAGGLVGWRENGFTSITHYKSVALWDIMELGAMLVTLYVGVATNRMDRGLWVALGINAFVLALSVLLFAALTSLHLSGQWSPRPSQVQMAKALLYIMMVAAASFRLRQMRRGAPVRGFFRSTDRAVASFEL